MRKPSQLVLSTTSLVALLSALGCSSDGGEARDPGVPAFTPGVGGPTPAAGGASSVTGPASVGGATSSTPVVTPGSPLEGQGGASLTPGAGGSAVAAGGAGGVAPAVPPPGPVGGYFDNGTWHGYAWTTTGVAGTTLTPTTFTDVAPGDPFCVQGVVAPDPPSAPGVNDGFEGFALLGFNINQAQFADVEGEEPPVLTFTPAAAGARGIAVSSNQQGAFELRVQIQGPPNAQGLPQGTWCAVIDVNAPRDAQGRSFVPYSAFNSACWETVKNPALNYQNQPIGAVTFQVPGDDADPRPYQFCVAGFAEGTTAADAPAQISVPLSGTIGRLPGERLARVKVLHDGKSYIVSNNAWGAASSDGSQVLSYDGARTTFQILTQTANGGNQPVSFPSIYIGANGFQGGGRFTTRNDDSLPIQISAINSLQTTFNHNATGGDYNATYDVWFVTAPPAGEYDGTRSINGAFLMVWTYRPDNRNPIQSGAPTAVQVDGRNWNLYVGPRGNESAFPNVPVISYVNEGDAITNYTFDLKDFIDDAVRRSQQGQLGGFQFNNNLYLTDVFAGFEIWSGGAGLRVDEFSAVVTPN